MMYNEISYWNERANPNSSKPKATEKHISFVNKNIKSEDKILDFGPGVGRILPAYENINRIWAFDISSKYTKNLIDKSKKINLEVDLTVNKEENIKLPYKDTQFDSVVCISVLLHQRPQHIINIMEELCRVGKKVIVVSWYEEGKVFTNTDTESKNEVYCFNYDFEKICSNNNMEISQWEVHPDLKQSFFVFNKKNKKVS